MCPGSNRVVNSIRFCLLWMTLDEGGTEGGGGRGVKEAKRQRSFEWHFLCQVSLRRGGAEAETRCSEEEQKVPHTHTHTLGNPCCIAVLKLQPSVAADGSRLASVTIGKDDRPVGGGG